MNAMVRELQPDILINNRSQLAEDFGTPEEHVTAEQAGPRLGSLHDLQRLLGLHALAPSTGAPCARWSACCARPRPARATCCSTSARKPDGSVPEEADERLIPVGKWLAQNGEAVYGQVERADERMEWMPTGEWTLKGNTAYFWCNRWPGGELVIGGLQTKVQRASLLATGATIAFEQTREPPGAQGPARDQPGHDRRRGVIKLECDSRRARCWARAARLFDPIKGA